MGPLLQPLMAPGRGRLVGVDLSSAMGDKARARGCYDRVEVGELVGWLHRQAGGRQPGGGGSSGGGEDGGSEGGRFDLLVAADVLVYIGDLRPLFAAAAGAAAGPG